MKQVLATLLLLAVLTPAEAQYNIDELLREIERNNPALKSAKAEAEAERLSDRAGILLPGPEVEFNYLRGGNDIGNRHDLRVTQSFDVPSLSGMRKEMLGRQNELTRMRYAARRVDLLLEAKMNLIELAYQQELTDVLLTHLAQARILVDAFEKRLSTGKAGMPDLSKARMHLAMVKGQVARATVDRQALLDALASLNGGIPLLPAPDTLSAETSSSRPVFLFPDNLPPDFGTWYAERAVHAPLMACLDRQLQVERQQLAIEKTAWLPDLTVGYMEEIGQSDRYRGLTSGLTIPLWSNATKIRASKAKITAAELQKISVERQFHDRLLSLFNSAKTWRATAERLHASLAANDNRTLLLEAETRGEISMVDYLYETEMYYDALEQALSADRAYRRALAELTAFEL